MTVIKQWSTARSCAALPFCPIARKALTHFLNLHRSKGIGGISEPLGINDRPAYGTALTRLPVPTAHAATMIEGAARCTQERPSRQNTKKTTDANNVNSEGGPSTAGTESDAPVSIYTRTEQEEP
jgi:hypothetical protein